jgi:serine protease
MAGRWRRWRPHAVSLGVAAAMSTMPTVVLQAAAAAPAGASTRLAGAAVSPDPAAVGHPYRRGIVPRRHPGTTGAVPAFPAPPTMLPATAHGLLPRGLLSYDGGTGGPGGLPGVTPGRPQVYLVFWGSNWGTAGSGTLNGNSYTTLSGDPAGVAPVLQAFFAGLGTDGELWSGVATQYCDGVAVAATSCPLPPAGNGTTEVGYPAGAALGGALAGVWEDTRAPAPSMASATQLAQEAVDAAGHFGNTTLSSNRQAQYVIVSPTGTNPDDYQGSVTPPGFCAWHDYSTDTFAVSPALPVAFTNLPYIPDAGAICGAGFVNGAAGALDGVTLVAGHEYAETLTDQYAGDGWSDPKGNELADKCAWVSGGAGGARNLTLATGPFPVQTLWANDAHGGLGGCEFAHPVVSDITVSSPGPQSVVVGASVAVPVSASDAAPGHGPLGYSAFGLPAGLGIDAVTGVISGTPSSVQTKVPATILVTDGAETASATFTWTVHPACVAQLLGNPGFENGTSPWSASSGVVRAGTVAEPAHGGTALALLSKVGRRMREQLSQKVTIVSWCASDTVSFWLHVDTTRSSLTSLDTLTVEAIGRGATTVLATFSNLSAAPGYVQHSYDVSSLAGSRLTLKIVLVEDTSSGSTTFALDDTALSSAP